MDRADLLKSRSGAVNEDFFDMFKPPENQFFNQCGHTFCELIEMKSAEFKQNCPKDVELGTRVIRLFLDELHGVLTLYSNLRTYFCRDAFEPITQIQLATLHKASIALYAGLIHNDMGLYGPSRQSLRYALESLIVAKHSTVVPASKALHKWVNEQPIYIGKDVFATVKSPDFTAIETLWGRLCDCSHFTPGSQQVVIGDDLITEGARVNVSTLYRSLIH